MDDSWFELARGSSATTPNSLNLVLGWKQERWIDDNSNSTRKLINNRIP